MPTVLWMRAQRIPGNAQTRPLHFLPRSSFVRASASIRKAFRGCKLGSELRKVIG